MFANSIFRNTVCLLPFLMMMDAPSDRGGSSAPPPAAPAAPLSLEDRLAKATADLTTGQAEIQRLTAELASRTTERDNAVNERADLQRQFTEATTTATTAQAEVARLNGEVTRINGELGTATTNLNRANGNVTRLESLCGIKGIDPNQAISVPAGEVPGALETAEDWNKKLAAAKSPEAQEQVLKDFEKACADGKVKKAPKQTNE